MRWRWTARDYALVALSKVEREGVFAAAALDHLLDRVSGLDPRDRALITELTYGVLRHRSRLDRALSPLSRKPLPSSHPSVLRALRVGAYQILLLDRIPARAAIDHAVTATRKNLGKRPAGYVNAVLRGLLRRGEPPLPDRDKNPGAYLRESLSFPEPIAEIMERRLDLRGAVELGEALNQRPRLTLRANALKVTREQLFHRFEDADPAVKAQNTGLSPEGVLADGLSDPVRHPMHKEGLFAVQQEGSQLIGHLLEPQPEERVLDLCCGAGGKTLHLAAMTRNRASITAIDSNRSRLSDARRRAEQAGVADVEWLEADLTEPLPESMHSRFHRVLLDAPCTGLGSLRRHPETKWRYSKENELQLVEQQKRILANGASAVRPGGILVYAVCTFTHSEGPLQVCDFLERHPGFEWAPPPLPANPAHRIVPEKGAMELWPHRHDTDGFYAARLMRKN